MKKIKLFIAALVLASAVVAISINSRTSNDPFLEANLEALLDVELPPAIITCDSGICGKCFMEEIVWPFYKCIWSGRQDDYCDCDKAGFTSIEDIVI